MQTVSNLIKIKIISYNLRIFRYIHEMIEEFNDFVDCPLRLLFN